MKPSPFVSISMPILMQAPRPSFIEPKYCSRQFKCGVFIDNIGPEPTFITGLPDILIEADKYNETTRAELLENLKVNNKVLKRANFVIKNKDFPRYCVRQEDKFINSRCSVMVRPKTRARGSSFF